MPLYNRQPHMSEILTNAVTQRNKMRDWRREVISRPVEEWVGQYMTVPMEDVEKLGGAAGDDDDDDDDEVFKLRPCLLGRLFVRTSNIGAKLSRYCELVLASRIYTVIRLVIAPVAFFNLAYLVPQQDYAPSSNFDYAVFYLDLIVNGVYILQALFQIGGCAIRFQFDKYRRHNTTSAEIIGQSGVLALPITALCFATGSDSYDGLWFRFVRLFFIVNTIFDFIPQSHILLSGIFYGIQSANFTFFILANLICMYACLGFSLFRYNDPLGFGSFSLSLFTWFRMATFDNWTNVYYQNLFGCDGIDADYTGTQENSVDPIQTHFGTFYLPLCSNPEAQPVAAGILFWSFTIIGPFVVLSVTLAAIAIGIVIRFDELQNSKFMEEGSEKRRRLSSVARSIVDGEDEERIDAIRDLVKFLWTGWVKKGADVSVEDAADLGLFVTVTDGLQKFLHRFSFRMFIIAVTLAGVCTAFLVDSSALVTQIFSVQLAVQVVLTLDLLARLVLHTPYAAHFFTSSWRVADMATIVLLWLPLLIPSDAFNVLQFLYFCRLFLALTYFFYIEELASVTTSIIESTWPFVYVTFLLIVFFYFYAISGILLFKEADPYHWATVGDALNTLLQLMTMDNWTYIARNAMLGCANIGYATGFAKYDELCFKNGGSGKGMGWFVAIHYVTFIIFAAFVLLSLLVGMILSSLEMLRQEILETKQVLKRAEPVVERHDFSDEEVEKLKALFFALDLSENGYLVFTDLYELFVILETPDEAQFPFFRAVDSDSNGRVDFAEFVDFVGVLKREQLPAHLRLHKAVPTDDAIEVENTDEAMLESRHQGQGGGVDLAPIVLPPEIEIPWDLDDGVSNFAEEAMFSNMTVNADEQVGSLARLGSLPESSTVRRGRRMSAKLFSANKSRLSL